MGLAAAREPIKGLEDAGPHRVKTRPKQNRPRLFTAPSTSHGRSRYASNTDQVLHGPATSSFSRVRRVHRRGYCEIAHHIEPHDRTKKTTGKTVSTTVRVHPFLYSDSRSKKGYGRFSSKSRSAENFAALS